MKLCIHWNDVHYDVKHVYYSFEMSLIENRRELGSYPDGEYNGVETLEIGETMI